MDSRIQSFDGIGFPTLFESKHRFKNQTGGKSGFSCEPLIVRMTLTESNVGRSAN